MDKGKLAGKVKNAFVIIGLLLIALAIEYMRRTYGIPVTILDILLFPLSLVFTFVLLKNFFFEQSREEKESMNAHSLRSITGRAAITVLLFFPLGLWSIWLGIQNPFEYFSGVKGAVHGYSLVVLGVFIFSIGIMLTISVIRSIISRSGR